VKYVRYNLPSIVFMLYSRFVVYLLCISLRTGACISRNIIIETFNFRKSKMRDTTGNKLSIIWLALWCTQCSSVMFDIIRKLWFWINNILTSVDFYAEIQVINRTEVIEVFHEQQTPGQSRKIVKYILTIISIQLLLIENCQLFTLFFLSNEKQPFIYTLCMCKMQPI